MDTILKNDQVLLILNAFYQNIGERNAETAASFFADDIDWYIPKSNVLPWTGKLTKKSEIINTLQLIFDAHVIGEDQIEIDHIFVDGNEAAVFGKASRIAKKTGKRFSTQFCQRFTFSDGKITKFLMLEDTPEIEKAF
jgi:ketosteroid isomerase-like protein